MQRVEFLGAVLDSLANGRLERLWPSSEEEEEEEAGGREAEEQADGGGERRRRLKEEEEERARVLSVTGFIMGGEDVVEGALEVLDRGDVQRVVTRQSGRDCHVVKGSRNSEYVCLGRDRYCSCPSYLHALRHTTTLQAITCKHLLAVQLAAPLHRESERRVEEEDFQAIVKNH